MPRPWESDVSTATIEWRILSPALRGRYELPVQMMPSLHGDEDARNEKRKADRASKAASSKGSGGSR